MISLMYVCLYVCIYMRSVQKVSSHTIRKIETFTEEDTRYRNPGGEGQIPCDLTFNWKIINKRKKANKI